MKKFTLTSALLAMHIVAASAGAPKSGINGVENQELRKEVTQKVSQGEGKVTSTVRPAQLINERIILPGDTGAVMGTSIFDSQKGLIRLSPDGKKVLFYRSELLEVNGRKGGVVRLVLRNLADGKEIVLPFPAVSKMFATYLPMLSCSSNPFNKTGDKIVLGVGVDTNNDGILDLKSEKMKAVVFDTITSKTVDLSVTGAMVSAGYSRGGDQYIVSVIEQQNAKKVRFLTSSTEELKWQECDLTGIPRAISPDNGLVMLVKSSQLKTGRHTRELPTDLLIHDLEQNKEITTLPTFKFKGALSMYVYVFVPQWVTSGTHLHYIDLIRTSGRPVHGTKIWDKKLRTITQELPNVIPIGPFKTESSMILVRVNEVKEGGSKMEEIMIRDAASNKTWTIPISDTRILGTHRGSIIYAKKDKNGTESVFMAQVVLR